MKRRDYCGDRPVWHSACGIKTRYTSPVFVVCDLVLALLIVGTSACRPEPTISARLPTPTPPIRHRDAYPLMLTIHDLAPEYEVAETHRLERGKGWDSDTTRLSGYRTVFQSEQELFYRVVCQVECYLSFQDAQDAYRVYKELLAGAVKKESVVVSEGDVDALGDWNWLFEVRAQDVQTFHYLFLRENVLVELALTRSVSPESADWAVRRARSIDQRIFER